MQFDVYRVEPLELRAEIAHMSTMKMNQSGRVKSQLEDEIITGALSPGDRLDEVSLAERFGVSRTPVREALQQLSIVGLIEHRPNRGAVVSAPDTKQLLEMFELMAELESICARLATRRMLISDEAEFGKTLDACRRAALSGDSDAYYYENERFHRAIYVAAGNTFILEQTMALHRRLAPFRRLQLRVRNRMQNSLAEHESIVEAILKGDADLAASCAYAHVAVQGERFNDRFSMIERPTIRGNQDILHSD